MPSFSYEADTPVAPERVLQALTDFSDRRLKVWPTIDRKYYQVHNVGETSADVTEGSAVFGGIHGREHYDWSAAGTVTATVTNSNIAEDGGTWEFRVTPRSGGGSHVGVNFDRKLHGLKGRMIAVVLGMAAKPMFRSNLVKTLTILEHEAPA